MSPITTSATGTTDSRPCRRTLASVGDRSMSPLIALRARSIECASSSCATENRNMTEAPSLHSPMPNAPAVAMVINTFMSQTPPRAARHARGAISQPPAIAERTSSTIAASDCPAPHCTARPAASSVPETVVVTIRPRRSQNGKGAAICASVRAVIPMSRTARWIVAADTAPTTTSLWATTSKANVATPGRGRSFASSCRTSLPQHIPSTVKICRRAARIAGAAMRSVVGVSSLGWLAMRFVCLVLRMTWERRVGGRSAGRIAGVDFVSHLGQRHTCR